MHSGDGTLPAHVFVSPTGKISHNVHTNYGPRFGFAYKVDDKTVVHGAYGIVFDDWAAVTQMAQNIEGAWPDIGQQIASSLTNVPTAAQPTPNVTAQNPFNASGSGLFPPPRRLPTTSGSMTHTLRIPTQSSGTLGSRDR